MVAADKVPPPPLLEFPVPKGADPLELLAEQVRKYVEHRDSYGRTVRDNGDELLKQMMVTDEGTPAVLKLPTPKQKRNLAEGCREFINNEILGPRRRRLLQQFADAEQQEQEAAAAVAQEVQNPQNHPAQALRRRRSSAPGAAVAIVPHVDEGPARRAAAVGAVGEVPPAAAASAAADTPAASEPEDQHGQQDQQHIQQHAQQQGLQGGRMQPGLGSPAPAASHLTPAVSAPTAALGNSDSSPSAAKALSLQHAMQQQQPRQQQELQAQAQQALAQRPAGSTAGGPAAAASEVRQLLVATGTDGLDGSSHDMASAMDGADPAHAIVMYSDSDEDVEDSPAQASQPLLPPLQLLQQPQQPQQPQQQLHVDRLQADKSSQPAATAPPVMLPCSQDKAVNHSSALNRHQPGSTSAASLLAAHPSTSPAAASKALRGTDAAGYATQEQLQLQPELAPSKATAAQGKAAGGVGDAAGSTGGLRCASLQQELLSQAQQAAAASPGHAAVRTARARSSAPDPGQHCQAVDSADDPNNMHSHPNAGASMGQAQDRIRASASQPAAAAALRAAAAASAAPSGCEFVSPISVQHCTSSSPGGSRPIQRKMTARKCGPQPPRRRLPLAAGSGGSGDHDAQDGGASGPQAAADRLWQHTAPTPHGAATADMTAPVEPALGRTSSSGTEGPSTAQAVLAAVFAVAPSAAAAAAAAAEVAVADGRRQARVEQSSDDEQEQQAPVDRMKSYLLQHRQTWKRLKQQYLQQQQLQQQQQPLVEGGSAVAGGAGGKAMTGGHQADHDSADSGAAAPAVTNDCQGTPAKVPAAVAAAPAAPLTATAALRTKGSGSVCKQRSRPQLIGPDSTSKQQQLQQQVLDAQEGHDQQQQPQEQPVEQRTGQDAGKAANRYSTLKCPQEPPASPHVRTQQGREVSSAGPAAVSTQDVAAAAAPEAVNCGAAGNSQDVSDAATAAGAAALAAMTSGGTSAAACSLGAINCTAGEPQGTNAGTDAVKATALAEGAATIRPSKKLKTADGTAAAAAAASERVAFSDAAAQSDSPALHADVEAAPAATGADVCAGMRSKQQPEATHSSAGDELLPQGSCSSSAASQGGSSAASGLQFIEAAASAGVATAAAVAGPGHTTHGAEAELAQQQQQPDQETAMAVDTTAAAAAGAELHSVLGAAHPTAGGTAAMPPPTPAAAAAQAAAQAAATAPGSESHSQAGSHMRKRQLSDDSVNAGGDSPEPQQAATKRRAVTALLQQQPHDPVSGDEDVSTSTLEAAAGTAAAVDAVDAATAVRVGVVELRGDCPMDEGLHQNQQQQLNSAAVGVGNMPAAPAADAALILPAGANLPPTGNQQQQLPETLAGTCNRRDEASRQERHENSSIAAVTDMEIHLHTNGRTAATAHAVGAPAESPLNQHGRQLANQGQYPGAMQPTPAGAKRQLGLNQNQEGQQQQKGQQQRKKQWTQQEKERLSRMLVGPSQRDPRLSFQARLAAAQASKAAATADAGALAASRHTTALATPAPAAAAPAPAAPAAAAAGNRRVVTSGVLGFAPATAGMAPQATQRAALGFGASLQRGGTGLQRAGPPQGPAQTTAGVTAVTTVAGSVGTAGDVDAAGAGAVKRAADGDAAGAAGTAGDVDGACGVGTAGDINLDAARARAHAMHGTSGMAACPKLTAVATGDWVHRYTQEAQQLQSWSVRMASLPSIATSAVPAAAYNPWQAVQQQPPAPLQQPTAAVQPQQTAAAVQPPTAANGATAAGLEYNAATTQQASMAVVQCLTEHESGGLTRDELIAAACAQLTVPIALHYVSLVVEAGLEEGYLEQDNNGHVQVAARLVDDPEYGLMVVY